MSALLPASQTVSLIGDHPLAKPSQMCEFTYRKALVGVIVIGTVITVASAMYSLACAIAALAITAIASVALYISVEAEDPKLALLLKYEPSKPTSFPVHDSVKAAILEAVNKIPPAEKSDILAKTLQIIKPLKGPNYTDKYLEGATEFDRAAIIEILRKIPMANRSDFTLRAIKLITEGNLFPLLYRSEVLESLLQIPTAEQDHFIAQVLKVITIDKVEPCSFQNYILKNLCKRNEAERDQLINPLSRLNSLMRLSSSQIFAAFRTMNLVSPLELEARMDRAITALKLEEIPEVSDEIKERRFEMIRVIVTSPLNEPLPEPLSNQIKELLSQYPNK